MRRPRPVGRPFESFVEEYGCSSEERRACLEYLAFLRFRALMRQPAGLRFLFLFFGEGALS